MLKLSESIERKFIDSIDIDEWEIETDSGWQDITSIHKTIEYEEWEIETEDEYFLIAADTHILFDENYNEVFVKDLTPNISYIKTKSGNSLVTKVINKGSSSHMYDITVDSRDHRFYTNDILSHNSTTIISYLLWCLLFNDNYSIALLANKGQLARDLLGKLRLAYEHIPDWLQQGVVTWNKGYLEFENGSKILASSTSSSAIRGGAYNCVLLDEFAHISDGVADEFFSSVYPTISSGSNSKLIIVSTPKGINKFHEIWQGALDGVNNYKPLRVYWQDFPGRDEKWKEETIKNTTLEQFNQEFECVTGDTIISIRDIDTGEVENVTIEELYNELQSIIRNEYEILTPSGWSKFNGIKRTTSKSIVTLITEHGNKLETTLNHRIKVDDSFCESQNINVGQEITSIQGLDKVIYTKIDNNDNEIYVYDLLDVENGNIYYTNNIVSHNCEFESTSTTLISYNALKVLLSKVELPLPGSDLHLKIYEEPKEKHKYITCVDCARGMGMDYSTFSVVDITSIPYKQVATYRNNTIVAMVFPEVIYRISKQYNDAEVLVEINDIGGQVADILYEDYEYENVISTSSSGGSQQISGNYDTTTKLGVKTSSTVKNLGCSNLKALVEHQQIIIPDRETVDELVYFSRKGRTFEAIVGHHDDMVISLVLFGWLTTQSYFKEMNENVNIRKTLHEMNQKQIEDSLTLVGFFDNGGDNGEDDDGWVTVKNPAYYGF